MGKPDLDRCLGNCSQGTKGDDHAVGSDGHGHQDIRTWTCCMTCGIADRTRADDSNSFCFASRILAGS
ncbi:hypothetical protein BRADI_1g47229v3 [Brachypodium distachyon]|uniref:Uncharacterized protein n=1 Tax=Brachypodium distachyon TaxID=15368 RepID=A0A2K2DPY9_BRADI|nr:hypothetical protein BRADI_1g47229v3 [Brachypodium distachyon]